MQVLYVYLQYTFRCTYIVQVWAYYSVFCQRPPPSQSPICGGLHFLERYSKSFGVVKLLFDFFMVLRLQSVGQNQRFSVFLAALSQKWSQFLHLIVLWRGIELQMIEFLLICKILRIFLEFFSSSFCSQLVNFYFLQNE